MASARLLLGLKISYGETTPLKSFSELKATITVEMGRPAKDFIVNPFVTKLLRTKRINPGFKLGYIKLRYYPDFNLLESLAHYPYPLLHQREAPKRGYSRSGIATTIETRVIEEAKRRYPKIKDFKSYAPSEKRREQLGKIGLTYLETWEGAKFQRYRRLLRRKLAKDLRAARTPVKVQNTPRRKKHL